MVESSRAQAAPVGMEYHAGFEAIENGLFQNSKTSGGRESNRDDGYAHAIVTMHRSVEMKQMRAGTFKARCCAVMKKVQATGQPVIVTLRGAPIAKVVALKPAKSDTFGFMAGKVKIVRDRESPIPA